MGCSEQDDALRIVTLIALLFIGHSFFASLVLALTHFRSDNYADQPLSRMAGLLLLACLVIAQCAHLAWLQFDLPWLSSPIYRMALYAIAPAFYLFVASLLRPDRRITLPVVALHAVPAFAAAGVSADWVVPGAFVLGAGYLLVLGRDLYGLRAERAVFEVEMALLAGLFGSAIAVAMLGWLQPVLPDRLFVSLYCIAIGTGLLIVQLVLGLRPRLSAEVAETARTRYASSSLGQVDCDEAVAKLAHLMQKEALFEDPELNLSRLAERLDLSSHQLSELLNAQLGKGLTRFLREHRVAAARRMLCDEPSASVLSIGLSVGFTSQSTFYEAFRDIEGMAPGQYRKLRCGQRRASTIPDVPE